MTSTEQNAYRLILKNGTVEQVFQVLSDISKDEPEIPDWLLSDITEAIQSHGVDASWKLAEPIHALIGKTQSAKLCQVAEKLGYLELDRFFAKTFTNGKVELFVRNLFYSEEGEQLAIDELFLWLTYFDQTVREEYLKTQNPLRQLESFSYDERLKKTQFFHTPLWPVNRLLEALYKIVSPAGREKLAALEYIFRPRLNEYRMAQQKQAADNNGMAVASTCQEDDLFDPELCLLTGWPSTKSLGAILDNITSIARGKVPS